MFKAFIIGNLGADAELHSENGSQFVTFKVAHNERFKDRAGNQNETSVWVSCVLNGAADSLIKYLQKGTTVSVFGDLRLKTYHSAKMHRLVAGADMFVRSIDLIGQRPDAVPSRLYDQEGVQHNVAKYFYCDTAKGQKLSTMSGLQFDCNKDGWVTPEISEVANNADTAESEGTVNPAVSSDVKEAEIF